MSLIFKGISNILSEINPPPPFSLPSGSSDSPTPIAPEGRAVVRMDGRMDGWTGDKKCPLICFFVAGYLTVSLRGPVPKPYDEGASPSCMDGWVGGDILGPLIGVGNGSGGIKFTGAERPF